MEENLKQQPSASLKIVLFGPESTGKTELAKQLAVHYNVPYVPEYSRIYAEKKLKEHKLLTKDDVMPIAIGQMELENEFARQSDKLLICDTDLLETKVYAEAYYEGYQNNSLTAAAINNRYNLYFLTYIDVPWVADEVRDKPNEREKMFNAFLDALNTYNKPYVLLKGTYSERFKLAVNHINKLILNQ